MYLYIFNFFLYHEVARNSLYSIKSNQSHIKKMLGDLFRTLKQESTFTLCDINHGSSSAKIDPCGYKNKVLISFKLHH